MQKNAFITLMANDQYLGAALTLMESGKTLNSKYPLYIMVTEKVSLVNIEILKCIGYKILPITEGIPNEYLKEKQRLSQENASIGQWHGDTLEDKGGQHAFSKLLIWQFTQFDKVCGIDLDILFLKNIDDVFDFTAPAGLEPDVNNYSASCIFLIEPNKIVFQKLIEYSNKFINDNLKLLNENTPLLFTDEQIIHLFFKEEMNKTIIPMTYSYNFNQCGLHQNIVQKWPHIRGIHICGYDKPGLIGKEYVQNYAHTGYFARGIWCYYISLYNQAATQVNQGGFSVPLFKED